MPHPEHRDRLRGQRGSGNLHTEPPSTPSGARHDGVLGPAPPASYERGSVPSRLSHTAPGHPAPGAEALPPARPHLPVQGPLIGSGEGGADGASSALPRRQRAAPSAGPALPAAAGGGAGAPASRG